MNSYIEGQKKYNEALKKALLRELKETIIEYLEITGENE